MLLRQPDYEDDISELYRAPKHGLPEARIPLIYDYFGKGGWKLYYIPAKRVDDEQMAMLAAHGIVEEAIVSRNIDKYESYVDTMMSANQATVMDGEMSAHEAVTEKMQFAYDGETVDDLLCQPCTEEVVNATFPGEVETHGVKDGLKGDK